MQRERTAGQAKKRKGASRSQLHLRCGAKAKEKYLFTNKQLGKEKDRIERSKVGGI